VCTAFRIDIMFTNIILDCTSHSLRNKYSSRQMPRKNSNKGTPNI
jgi:hypothetical protein